MNRTILTTLVMTVAALLAIACGVYLLSTHSAPKVPEKQITLNLDQPNGMKDYIQEWIPAWPEDQDELLGSIEDEPVTMTVRRKNSACSFETSLITVNIDNAQGGRVQRIFVSSRGMTLDESVSSMKQVLLMLDTRSDKLQKWVKGAMAWSRDPKSWPTDVLTPMDAWYSEIVRTPDIECELEIRRSGDETLPWRIVIRTGPRMFHGPGGVSPQR